MRELMKSEFNVLKEGWIPVRFLDGKVKAVGIEELLAKADEIDWLAAETETQASAIFRMILAVVHKWIVNYTPDGKLDPLRKPNQVYPRWKAYWKAGRFPETAIAQFVEENYDKFFLIDEQHPFMQSSLPLQCMPAKAVGERKTLYYGASKLIGDCSESSNKARLFQRRTEAARKSLSYAEAASWLLHAIGYDDTSGKPSAAARERKKDTGEQAPSTGCGWLGKIGQIYARGENLFESILLNTVLLTENNQLWPEDKFPWDRPGQEMKERQEIPAPDSFAELMTVRSRHLLLDIDQEAKRVNGYWSVGGEFFDPLNAKEPFTLWRTKKDKKVVEGTIPKRHSDGRQAWRDFAAMTDPDPEEMERQPALLKWIADLENHDCLPEDQTIYFEMPYVTYGDKDFMVTNISSQGMLFYPALLKTSGQAWRGLIQEEIAKIEKLASCCGYFYKNLALSKGKRGKTEDLKKVFAKGSQALYEAVDSPFRLWLSSLNPLETEDESAGKQMTSRREAWEQQAANLAKNIVKVRIAKEQESLNLQALLGRANSDGDANTPTISVFEAEQIFNRQIRSIYPSSNAKKGD